MLVRNLRTGIEEKMLHYVKRNYGQVYGSRRTLENVNKVDRVSRVEVIYGATGELNIV